MDLKLYLSPLLDLPLRSAILLCRLARSFFIHKKEMSMHKLVSIGAIAFVCVFSANAQSGKVLSLDQKVNGAITKVSTISRFYTEANEGDEYYCDLYTISLKARQKVTINLASDYPLAIGVVMGGKHYLLTCGGEKHADLHLTFAAGTEPQTAVVQIQGPTKFSVSRLGVALASQSYVLSVTAAAKDAYASSAQEDEYGGN
jgi:hypothetical protein